MGDFLSSRVSVGISRHGIDYLILVLPLSGLVLCLRRGIWFLNIVWRCYNKNFWNSWKRITVIDDHKSKNCLSKVSWSLSYITSVDIYALAIWYQGLKTDGGMLMFLGAFTTNSKNQHDSSVMFVRLYLPAHELLNELWNLIRGCFAKICYHIQSLVRIGQ